MTPRALSIASAVLAASAVPLATGCPGELTPEGDTHRYVIADFDLPDTPGQASMFSLDLDGSNRRPNQFGAALAGLELDAVATAGIRSGGSTLLLELQTRDLATAAASGVSIHVGDVLGPPPCNGPDDCGNHLSGNGTFAIAPSSPDHPALVGSIRNGTFLSSSGNELTLLFSLDGRTAIEIPLLAARVQLALLTESSIGRGTIAGGIPQSFLLDRFLDEIRIGSVGPLVESCNFNGMTCTCVAGSVGAILQAAFDTDRNCNISLPEITGNAALNQLLSVDLTVDGRPMVSFGMSFTAIRATF